MKRKRIIAGIIALLIVTTVMSMAEISVFNMPLATVAKAAVSSSVVSGELKLYISSISTSGGTTRLSVDNLRGNLNRKSSSAPDRWLYASFATNADEAITGIWIKSSGSLTTIDGYSVTKASDNVNSASKTACYIYYTKDKNAGDPIASVGVWQSEDDYFEYVTNVGSELQEYYNTGFNDHYTEYGYTRVGGDSSDLNTDAGSKTAYVYVYYKRAPHVKTQAVEYCYDGQPHNGIVTASDGATVTYEKSYTAIGSYNQVYKVTKDGMITISGDTPVKISNHDYSISLNNKVAATCKAAGHETDMKCSKCGDIKAGAEISKLEHTYKNLFCTACGALEPGYTRIKTSTTYYKIDGDTVYIDGKGEIPTSAFKKQTGIDTTVTKAIIGNSITKIGNSAFNACKSLTSVTIPNSVTSIGNLAFYACTGLTSITIPDSVTSIGDSAFDYCTSLTSITIPGSVKSLDRNIFYLCTSLKTVVLQNGVTSISETMFHKCSALNSITIPNTVTSIGSYAFSGCTSLKSVTIPSGVKSIDSAAFAGCTGMTSVTISDGVTSIGSLAFTNTGLTSVTIPNSVTSLASDAFSNNSKMTAATLPCRLNYYFNSNVKVTKNHVGEAVTDASKVATCTENGLTEGTHCSVCNAALTVQKVIPANGHTWKDATCFAPKTCTVCGATEGEIPGHIWGNWNVWEEPSCTSTGIRGRICERCHAEEKEEIPMTEHYWGSWNVWEEPSCDSTGIRGRYCERCYAEETEEIPMIDHTWSGWDVWEEPTCAEVGIRGRICECCYAEETEEIPQTTDHHWGDWNVWQEPSCTSTGIRGRYCERCYAEETEEILMTDHYWGDWNVWQEPSCTEAGVRGRICERCYAEETEEIPQTTDHYWGDWNVWQEPSCTEAGVRGRICERCHQDEQETIEASGHEWQNGICKKCGIHAPDEMQLAINDNEFTVTLNGPNSGTGIVIVGVYDSDKLLEIKMFDISKNKTPQGTFTQSGLVKVMWWNDMEGMKPICECVQKTMSK